VIISHQKTFYYCKKNRIRGPRSLSHHNIASHLACISIITKCLRCNAIAIPGRKITILWWFCFFSLQWLLRYLKIKFCDCFYHQPNFVVVSFFNSQWLPRYSKIKFCDGLSSTKFYGGFVF